MQDKSPEQLSVAAKILAHMKKGRSISALEAMNLFGCMRLSARIYQLKHDGHDIDSEREKNIKTGKSYSRYWLTKDCDGGTYSKPESTLQ